MASLVGSRVERKEDKKLLTGRGKYTADVNFVNQTFAYFVRSPHASCLLYTSPSPRDKRQSRMPSSA